MTEIWKPVAGYTGRYEVSNLGRVRSLMTNHGARVEPLLLSLQKHPDSGYWQVNFKVKGKVTRPYVAHLVLEAFVCARPNGLEACHNDGDQDNNTLGNLRWDTHEANIADKKAHGTDGAGERNARAKLTQKDVDQIRTRLASGERNVHVATAFGVSAGAIQGIKSGRRWAQEA